MNWDAIATIAEVVSALGVIISLLYVAAQIRQSNRVSQANTIHLTNSEYGSIIGELASDESLAKIFSAAAKGEKLAEVDFVRYISFLTRYFVYLENVYHQEKANLFDMGLGTDNVMAFMADQSKGFLVSQQTLKWWAEDVPKFMSPEFYEVASRHMKIEGTK